MVNSDAITDGLKWVPSVLVTSSTFLGISWENWVYILTAIWTLLQIGDWVWGKVKARRKKREQS